MGNNNFIRSLSKRVIYSDKNTYSDRNIHFADFETTIVNNQHYVTCISFINSNLGFRPLTFCVEDYHEGYDISKQSTSIMEKFVSYFLKEERKRYNNDIIIYFHNLGRFDGVFILYYLTHLKKNSGINMDVITRENTIYEISLKGEFNNIVFRDSYLLFPQSLSKMAEIFSSRDKMEFKDISNSIDKYDKEFKRKLVIYCENDVLILRESMKAYSKVIFEYFHIDIYQNLTLSSLAFKIFRTSFYNDSSIYQSHKHLDTFIRRSYKGGIVEVYRPILKDGYYYDVNSLYPYVMSVNDMPIDKPYKGIVKDNKNFDINTFFGFIQVKVKSPKNLYIPFLTVKDDDLGLISPIGEWTDIYFSEEIKYALTLGYEFEYIDYYQFKRDNIFKNYVTNLYEKRLQNKDKPALSGVFKLLLNSLYGRFGMSNSVYKNLFIDDEAESEKILDDIMLLHNTSIVNTFKRDDGSCVKLVRYDEISNRAHLRELLDKRVIDQDKYENCLKNIDAKSRNLNVAVHISSAITAYARIYMHKIKNQYKDSLYYSDTDSIIVDRPISDDLISKTELGLLKLEYKIKQGIFIAPKLYYIESDDNQIVKSKGINPNLMDYEDFVKLYNEESVKLSITNYFIRNFKDYTINLKESDLELNGCLHKREKIYRENKWVDTYPLFYKQ